MASAKDVRERAETLATFLGRNQGKEQRQNFFLYLEDYEHLNCLERVINHPLQRYNGRTLIHLAAVNGLWEYLEQLLKKGGDPNKASAPPDLCQTPLHLAAHNGYAKCLSILLNYGATIRVENSHRVTPLDLVRGKEKCEAVIFQAIAKVDIPPRSMEQQQLVRDLHQTLEDGVENDKFFARFQKLRDVDRDLAARWTDWFQQTLLCRAVGVKNEEVVSFLLSQSSSRPLSNLGNGDTPLLVACRNSSLEIASHLLVHSASLALICDAQNRLYPLHIAASRGDHRLVKLILDALGALFKRDKNIPHDINFVDRLGRTPLFNACYHGRAEVVRQLLAFNKSIPGSVDVNSQVEGTGRTPLHAAVAKESLEIIKLLLQDTRINISIEACPSSQTRQVLRKLLVRKRSQTVLSPTRDHSIPIAASLPVDTFFDHFSPPSSHEMSSSSQVSDDIDTDMGLFSSPVHSSSPSSPDRTSSAGSTSPDLSLVASTQEYRRAPKVNRSATVDVFGQDVSSYDIYVNHEGFLESSDSELPGGRKFSDTRITPLAEACVFKNTAIVEQLLHFGAFDRNGMACQIANLLKRDSIVRMILSRDCRVFVDHDLDRSEDTRCRLSWNDKHLQKISGKWLDNTCTFFMRPSDEDDDLPLQHVKFQEVNYLTVTQVQLGNNFLTSVPVELFCLPNVIKIDLSNNRLVDIPENPITEWKCGCLQSLNVSSNLLKAIPTSVWYVQSLRKFRAENNQIKRLCSTDVEHSICPELEELHLQHNKLEFLPDFIFEFPKLTKAFLARNLLVSLPDLVWSNETLEELDLSSNHLSNLPFSEVNELEESIPSVSASSPSVFTMATASVGNQKTVMHRMRSLYTSRRKSLRTTHSVKDSVKVSHVEAQLAPTDAIELEYCDYSALRKLNLSKNQLTFFPTIFPCLTPNLDELDISSNPVTAIDIRFLPQGLKKLMAKNCRIERFGQTMTKDQLKKIQSRCVYESQAAVCNHRHHDSLQFLATLHLANNKLTNLLLLKHRPPDTLDSNGGIGVKESEFVASNSTLDLLYPGLEGLDLTGNKLEGCFNPNIGRQNQLKWIRFINNPSLERIPTEFAHLKKGNLLTLLEITAGLPRLVQPPPEYQTRETTAGQLLTYLRSLLKKSSPFRTMKLFFIGEGERGKTTLLHRLRRENFVEKIDRTEGIDIEDWECRGAKGVFGFHSRNRDPINFLCWDFAGQGVYQVTHQCFYSCRSLYLALFRLSDGLNGVAELDHWLRNVQLRAPGCVVIVVGSHLDKVTEQVSNELEMEISRRYSNSRGIYPQVVACVSVSCSKKINNNIDKLRQLIYDTATHLAMSNKDSSRLEYSPKLADNDPQLLLQQQIPHSFITLQDSIREAVAKHRFEQRSPIMEDSQFLNEFKHLFDDEEELREAVYYLNLQGTLLHFKDFSLRKWYFLDPQWLAKLMAKVINHRAMDEESPFNDGKASICNLFLCEKDIQDRKPQLQETYVNLLEKFEVVLKINTEEVIIPSLMEGRGQYPKPSDNLSDVTMAGYHQDCYQPPLRRIWLSHFIPNGFWPRLICRVVKDNQIKSVLKIFPGPKSNLLLNWVLWKTGMAFVFRGRTLLLVSQDENSQLEQPDESRKNKVWKYRLTLSVYIPDMLQALAEVDNLGSLDDNVLDPYVITGQATRLLVAISNHVLSLDSWFNSMLLSQQGHSYDVGLLNIGYIPCWKCYGSIEYSQAPPASYYGGPVILGDNDKPLHCFGFSDCITSASSGEDLQCPFHGSIKSVHIAPDLVFRDLEILRENKLVKSSTLHIKSEILGKGGFGFVCKGELMQERDNVCVEKRQVAVKVFLEDIEQLDSRGVQELVKLSNTPLQLCHSYKEIRQEVSFLSSLDHANIAKLCGVKMQPTMCLLLELAPKKALRSLLKEYQSYSQALEPLTIQQCALQIASGLYYLHCQQVVHLDMKSSNVLVWEFPDPLLPRNQRVQQANNVCLKITDYGISQISPSMIIRVESKPIGTPGYMAPELFSGPGQEILATKVDVFAYGMVLYELISQQVPFYKHQAQKRNAEVKRNHRPSMGIKAKQSPVLVRDMMSLCWHQNPELRPNMNQCKQWAASDEFVRLRAYFTLSDVSSVACACVSHIDLNRLPQQHSIEETDMATHSEILQPQYFDKDTEEVVVVKEEKEAKTRDNDWEVVQMAAKSAADSAPKSSGESTSQEQLRSAPAATTDAVAPVASKETAKRIVDDKSIEEYTQMWMCGRDKKKGLFAAFLFPDNQKSNYSYFGSMGQDDVHSMCLIRDTVWMGTASGIMRILHAPTAKLIHSWNLPCSEHKSSSILKILHVEEKSCVLVTTHSDEIWSLCDRLVHKTGLAVQQKLQIDDYSVYDLVKVNLPDGSLEVWGTMDNNTLVLLEPDGEIGDRWKWSQHKLKPVGHMKFCSHIVCCSFVSKEGREERHLWVSYRGRGYLVCFDAQKRTDYRAINFVELLRSHFEDNGDYNVTTLLAHGKTLYVGTMSGVVASLNSETGQLLSCLAWHTGKVRFLLALPDTLRACISAEVPLDRSTTGRGRIASSPSHDSSNAVSSSNPLIASIGNGRRRYSAVDQQVSSRTRDRFRVHEDVTLLVWQS